MHGKMVYNSCGTGKTWIFKDLDRISDSREDLGTVFRENLVFVQLSTVLNNDRPSFVYPLLRTSYFVFPRRIMKTEETSERQETRDQPESKTQNPERRRYRNCYMLPTLLPIL